MQHEPFARPLCCMQGMQPVQLYRPCAAHTSPRAHCACNTWGWQETHIAGWTQHYTWHRGAGHELYVLPRTDSQCSVCSAVSMLGTACSVHPMLALHAMCTVKPGTRACCIQVDLAPWALHRGLSQSRLQTSPATFI